MRSISLTDGNEVIICDGDLTAELADELLTCDVVAVDTETSGLDWSTDELHLCQLLSPRTGVVLVRPGRTAPAQLERVLSDRRTAKVFHFAPFDLRFLYSTWHINVHNAHCTKTAHKLLHPDAKSHQHSLSTLVELYLGVHLLKGAVRTSDWSADPLSEEQIRYATNDVAYLIPLLTRLRSELQAAGKGALYDSVCEYLPTGVELEVDNYPDPFDY